MRRSNAVKNVAARPMMNSLGVRAKGFTLVELVIVMAIAAILTAIAIPNYWAYIARSNRSEARSQVLIAANWVERWRTQSGSYAGAVLPPSLTQSPAQGAPKYDIALPPALLTAVAYTITATPRAPGPMAADVCTSISIDHTGQRTFTGGTQEVCWGR